MHVVCPHEPRGIVQEELQPTFHQKARGVYLQVQSKYAKRISKVSPLKWGDLPPEWINEDTHTHACAHTHTHRA